MSIETLAMAGRLRQIVTEEIKIANPCLPQEVRIPIPRDAFKAAWEDLKPRSMTLGTRTVILTPDAPESL